MVEDQPDTLADAPPQARFPGVPAGWYYLCPSRALRPGPIGVGLGPAKFAAFRNNAGRVAVLGARCSHMGADLAGGRVNGDCVACPLHGWEYAADGSCRRIAALPVIPRFARQSAYPTAELDGHVYFCNRVAAPYPMPFFDGINAGDLMPARPFEFRVAIPWYLVAANAFDVQHFRTAHDRMLIGEPVIDSPTPLSRRISATYRVTGNSLRDRLTRLLSGADVTLTATIWGGTILLVSSRFRRTTSYGLVSVRPVDEGHSQLTVVVWIPRRKSAVARVLDPLDAAIRRSFIRAFLRPDSIAAAGIRYNPRTLIDADRELGSYLDWLGSTSGGTPIMCDP